RRIEFVEALPKTDSGNIRLVDLRDGELASVDGLSNAQPS
ncbi:acyl--CoA ligase, partial [Listeria monocytogenes]